MKKIFALAFAAISLAACNDGQTDNSTTDADVDINTTMNDSIAAIEMDTTNTATATTYAPVEGDVTMRDKKVMVYRNGSWVEANEDVKMDDGVVVHRDGRVTKEGKEVELEEGEVVNRTGKFLDNTGRVIENAWDATKEGVKDAGKAVKKAGQKVGDKVEDAFDKDRQ